MRREPLGRIALLLGLAGLIAWFWILRSRVEPDATRADVAAPEELREPVRLVFRSGSDSLVVERTVAVGAGGGDIRLLVDLNSAVWLATTNPATRLVSRSAFQGAVRIETR